MNYFWRKDVDTEVASKVVEATAAAAQAVRSCDAARLHAIEVVAAGNDVAHRHDEAAPAALDAAIRCAAASLAAQEAASRCEEVAEEADANYRASATMAAQEARAAAARCDVEGGAPAASQAANSFADSCVAACGDAKTLTLEAGEAAARCVLARDDVATAKLVFLKTRGFCVSRAAFSKACSDSYECHMEARKDAVAAALAARKAALRCAAASRHAVSAASVARKTASRCDAPGGYYGPVTRAAAAAATSARHAADRCVAAHADGAEAAAVPPTDEEVAAGTNAAESADAAARTVPMVPLADAAAFEARKAAARCDAALADPVADANKEFFEKMCGWLLAVATLFVGIAFQAITQPPAGMSFDHCGIGTKAGKAAYGAPSPAPAPALSPTETADKRWHGSGACFYLVLNTLTMAVALAMLLLLLITRKSANGFTLHHIKGMLVMLACSVAISFVIGASGDPGIQVGTSLTLLLFAIVNSLVPLIGVCFSVRKVE